MRPAPRRLRVQFATLTTGRIVASATSALWMVIAARLLSVDEFGDLGLLLALSAMLGVVADMGYPIVLTRETARQGAISRHLLRGVIRRRFVGGSLASVLLVLFYEVASAGSRLWLAALFGASILSTATYSSVTAALRGVGVVAPDAINEVASRLLVLLVGWALLARGGGVVAAVAVYVAADLLSALVLLAVGRRHTVDAPAPAGLLHLRQVLPIGIGALLAVVYYRLDVWLLGVFLDSTAVAEYVAAYRVLDGLLLPAGALGALVVGRIASVAAERRSAYVARLAVGIGGLLVVPAIAIGVVAEPALAFVFGDDYRGASITLIWLLVSAPVGAAVMVLAPAVSAEAPRRVVPIVAIALVANSLLNLFAIPSYGPPGAAVATAASQAGLVAMLYVALQRATATAAT